MRTVFFLILVSLSVTAAHAQTTAQTNISLLCDGTSFEYTVTTSSFTFVTDCIEVLIPDCVPGMSVTVCNFSISSSIISSGNFTLVSAPTGCDGPYTYLSSDGNCQVKFFSDGSVQVISLNEIIWFLDADNDGFYSETQQANGSPGEGWSEFPGLGGNDCVDDPDNPESVLFHPGAESAMDWDAVLTAGSVNCSGTITVGIQDYNCDHAVSVVAVRDDGFFLPPLDNEFGLSNIFYGTYSGLSFGSYTLVGCNDAGECIEMDVEATCEIQTWYQDADEDGYHGQTVEQGESPGVGWSLLPGSGFELCDNAFEQNPGKTEVCDGIDNDCDGATDEGIALASGTLQIVQATNVTKHGCKDGAIAFAFTGNDCWEQLLVFASPVDNTTPKHITIVPGASQYVIAGLGPNTYNLSLQHPSTGELVQSVSQSIVIEEPPVADDFDLTAVVPSFQLGEGCTQVVTVSLSTSNCYEKWFVNLELCQTDGQGGLACDGGAAAAAIGLDNLQGNPGQDIHLLLPGLDNAQKQFKIKTEVLLNSNQLLPLPEEEQFLPHVSILASNVGTLTHNINEAPTTECANNGIVTFTLSGAIGNCTPEDGDESWTITLERYTAGNLQFDVYTKAGSWPEGGSPDPIVFNDLLPGQYHYYASGTNNNSSAQQYTLSAANGGTGPSVSIVPNGVFQVAANGALEWCSTNSPITLTATPSTGFTYTWFSSTGGLVQQGVNASTHLVSTANQAGTYTVKVTGENGCTAESQPVTIVDLAVPPPGEISGPKLGLCKNTTATYSLPQVNFPNVTYTWTVTPLNAFELLSAQGSNQMTVKFKSNFTSGSIQAVVSSPSSPCAPQSVNALFLSSTLGSIGSIAGEGAACKGTIYTYTIPPVAGATSYEWTVDNHGQILSQQGTQASIKFNKLSTQLQSDPKIKVTAKNDCGKKVEAVKFINVLNCEREAEIEDTSLDLYPNPTTGSISIKTDLEGIVLVEVVDLLGRYLRSKEVFSNGLLTEDMSNLPSGTYIIRVRNESQTTQQKFVKE